LSALILVVDDEPDVADLFRRQFSGELRAARSTRDFAQSAAQALDFVAEARKASLILSDVNISRCVLPPWALRFERSQGREGVAPVNRCSTDR
jgi:CheY-like chemotaxis protein